MKKLAEPSPDEDRLKRLINARGLANRYGIHLRTVSRWVARGVVPPPDQIINDKRYWYVVTLVEADRKRTIAAGKGAAANHATP